MSQKNIVYGLDFGTSNSAVAALEDGELRVIEAGLGGRPVERSLVYFPEAPVGARHIGEDAANQYVWQGMRGRLIQSVKTLLPDKSFETTEIHGREVGAEWLASLMVAEMKARADAATGSDVRRVVMGRPARFSDDDPEADALAEKRLRKAAELAGFEEIRFQFEPIAAAFSYERRLDAPQTALIADLGAGTSDFTLMRLDPKRARLTDRRGDILATGGIHVGGDDFDAEIMWGGVVHHFGRGAKWDAGGKWLDLPHHIFRSLCRREEVAFLKDRRTGESLQRFRHSCERPEAIERLIALVEGNMAFSLFQAVERAKVELSDNDLARIDFVDRGVEISQPVALKEFDAMCDRIVGDLARFVDEFLEQAGAAPSDVDAVFLTGGGSFVRSEREVFASRFGEDKLRGGEAFTSVAAGLALSAPLLFGDGK